MEVSRIIDVSPTNFGWHPEGRLSNSLFIYFRGVVMTHLPVSKNQ